MTGDRILVVPAEIENVVAHKVSSPPRSTPYSQYRFRTPTGPASIIYYNITNPISHPGTWQSRVDELRGALDRRGRCRLVVREVVEFNSPHFIVLRVLPPEPQWRRAARCAVRASLTFLHFVNNRLKDDQ